MKKSLRESISPLLGAAILFVSLPSTAGKPEVVDEIVAVIENEIITRRELVAKVKPYLAKVQAISDPEQREKERDALMRKVLDIEIGERIVDAEIGRNKDRLGVTDKDVDQAVQEVLRMNNLTEERLQAALYAQSMTWSEYRKKLRSQIERARLIQFKVQGKVQIKKEDALRRCKERQLAGTRKVKVCASHILQKIPTDATKEQIDELHARLSQLQSELSAGADFAAYALKHSEDTSAPDGDIGCFGHGEMVEPFEKAVFALKVGEVSSVVRTQFGFHIIKATDRRTPSSGACNDEAQLTTFRNELYQEELDRQMQLWLADLRRKAFVEVRL